MLIMRDQPSLYFISIFAFHNGDLFVDQVLICQSLTIVFYLSALNLHNWKNELKSHPVGEQPNGLFKPFTALNIVAANFNPQCETFKYLQAIVGPHIEARELTFTRADVGK